MKKIWLKILGSLMILVLAGCGGESNKISESQKSEYKEGMKLVDLMDEESYAENGRKMANAVETALNASENELHMMEAKPKLFKNGVIFQETFTTSKRNCYYVGELKDGKPDGFGVLLNEGLKIEYVGKFTKGEVKNSYGISIDYYDYNVEIAYDGVVEYLNKELYACPADGKREILWGVDDVQREYGNSGSVIDANVSQAIVVKCLPKYIGEIKNGEYNGEGCRYYANGILAYEGEFKGGVFSGKGKEYSRMGNLIKEGTFKKGELEEGTYDKEQESIDDEAFYGNSYFDDEGEMAISQGTSEIGYAEESDFWGDDEYYESPYPDGMNYALEEVRKSEIAGHYGGVRGQSDGEINIYAEPGENWEYGYVSLYLDSEIPVYGGLNIEGELMGLDMNLYYIYNPNMDESILLGIDRDDYGVSMELYIDNAYVETYFMLEHYM